MPQVINTNTLSLMTQNNMNTSQSALNTAIQRLSSGLRINSAKDDAAGQAIANRFTANIRGLTQAQRNANDGISLAQTTEGALTEVNNNLQRIRELAVQAATGSNSASDLKSIQDEIQQRLDEIDRTSQQTDFNGVKVLSSSAKPLTIQVGANDGETITIALKEISAQSLGLKNFSVASAKPQMGAAITEIGDGSGAMASVDLSTFATSLETALGLSAGSIDASELSLHNLHDSTGAATGNFAVAYNGELYAADMTAAAAPDLYTTDVTVTDGSLTGTVAGVATKVGVDATGNPVGYITYKGNNYNAADLAGGATTIDVSDPADAFVTQASANPLAKIDAALKTVDDLRSSLGAVQNRFDSAISNLGTTVTNLSASRSRIQDADYATEVSNMTRAQILQQAGTSVLAQANQTTQNVLSLLR